MMKVYLSGGMRSNWQDTVKNAINAKVHWIDPRLHGLKTPDQYAVWDFAGVDHCDVVFAYMEADNPSGAGLMAEVGYALGRNKVVIFVDEKTDKYMQLIVPRVDYYCTHLSYGITMLQSLEVIYA